MDANSGERRWYPAQPQELHTVLRFTGLGAVDEYSAAVSHPLWSRSAEANLSTVFTAHSSKESEPLPFLSSLAKALRRGS
jgi:hypothetical protein